MYLPERIVKTSELVDRLKARPMMSLERFTGIKERRHGSEDENTYTISLKAMKDCLAHSRYEARDLDIIISCSISRFGKNGEAVFEPPLSLVLKEEIKADRAKFMSICNACAGMGTGVHILDNMIKSGAVKNGMVVSGELISGGSDTAVREISEPLDPQFASLTIGDAGAAVIMEAAAPGDEGIEYTHFATMAEFSDLCFGLPSHDSGSIAMYTDSLGIHRETLARLAPFVHSVFKRKRGAAAANEWDYGIDWVIPHQTSVSAMETGQRKISSYFGVRREYADRVLLSKYIGKFGNTASTSHFVVLANAIRDGTIRKGDKVLLLMQASGIVLGLISVKLGDLKAPGRKETDR